MNNYHTPVLLDEVIEGLNIKKDGIYVDGTIGGGGHTQKILEMGAIAIGIDQDEDAILHINKKFDKELKDKRLFLVKGNFSSIKELVSDVGFEKVDGILLDLGVSSHQFDTSTRGFSFRTDEKLDMRMTKDVQNTAADLVNGLSEDELYDIFSKYGEEPNARKIAKAIVERRQIEKIETTGQLSALINEIVKNAGNINPSTRVFQALRIEVNDELGNLRKGLEGGFEVLNSGGRMCIISFHSLEDRIVKLFNIKKISQGEAIVVNKKPITPGTVEQEANRRSRSAKLRVIEKIK